jgi:hypothetical protein
MNLHQSGLEVGIDGTFFLIKGGQLGPCFLLDVVLEYLHVSIVVFLNKFRLLITIIVPKRSRDTSKRFLKSPPTLIIEYY